MPNPKYVGVHCILKQSACATPDLAKDKFKHVFLPLPHIRTTVKPQHS